MRFSTFFAPIGMIALPRALALVMTEANSGSLAAPSNFTLKNYDIPIDYHYYHDFGIVDVDIEIPGADSKTDHIEVPVHVKANASPIHLNEWYTLNIFFKNEWTDAHRWEASVPIIGTLYVDLQTRIVRSNCKLALKLHLTGTGVLGRLEESIDLPEIAQDGIKFLAKGMGLC